MIRLNVKSGCENSRSEVWLTSVTVLVPVALGVLVESGKHDGEDLGGIVTDQAHDVLIVPVIQCSFSNLEHIIYSWSQKLVSYHIVQIFRQNKKNVHIFILFKRFFLSSVWKDGSQNHTVIAGKGSNTQKSWKTKEFVGPEGFFWITAGSLTVQDKQGTHEQLLLNKKKTTVVDNSGKNTILRIKGM